MKEISLIENKIFQKNYFFTVKEIELVLFTNKYHYLCAIMMDKLTNK